MVRDTTPTGGYLEIQQHVTYPIYTGTSNYTSASNTSITLSVTNTSTGTSATTDNLWLPNGTGSTTNWYNNCDDREWIRESRRRDRWQAESAADEQWRVLHRYAYDGQRRDQIPGAFNQLDELARQVGAQLPETAEERQARIEMAVSDRLRREEVQRQRQTERALVGDLRAKAQLRAEDLLLSCLTEEQRKMLKESGKFRLVGSNGSIYEIKRGRQHNIFKLDAQGNRVEELCVHPGPHMPNADTMLLQKVSLETDEAEMRQIANIWDMSSRRLISGSGRAALN